MKKEKIEKVIAEMEAWATSAVKTQARLKGAEARAARNTVRIVARWIQDLKEAQ